MATVEDTIKRSMRLIKAIDGEGTPSATEFTDGVAILNSMMARWEEDGLSLGWSPVSGTADTLPGPASAEEAIVYNLALRMAPEYPGSELGTLVVEGAMSGFNAILRDSTKNTLEPSDTSHLPGTFGRWDINSDYN